MMMKRWLLIRHIRWLYHRQQVIKHYRFYRSVGYLPVNAAYDKACLDEIWRGER